MAFGIDLGTTHSCVAHIDDTGRPAVIPSAIGEDTTPSVVYFESPRNVIVGRAAKNAALADPDLVAQLVKRAMGTNAEYTFHGARHTPEMVSALILRELARSAEEQTGKVVRDVVITVPAYFGVAEREATRRAGDLAGLNVLDVLAEPVAAALHYETVASKSAGKRHILVYDLGGGTFDTTVIRLDGDDISVVCTDGDLRLGGADWDEAITSFLLGEFTASYPGLRPQDDPSFMQDLAINTEQLKVQLSQAMSRRQVIRYGGKVARVEVSREQLEKITAHLLDRTLAVTERTINTAAGHGVGHFDDVLLVGGMTRMPAVARALKERLGLEARQHEPALAVAKGAALFALMRNVRPDGGGPGTGGRVGGGTGGTARVPLRTTEEVAASTGLTVSEVEEIARKRVATVVPRGFGVCAIDGRDPLAATDPVRARKMIVHLLPANTSLPADSGPFTAQTAMDNQRIVAVEVWEQVSETESDELADNRKIGEGLLRNLPPRLPAYTPIEVTFFMSETGVLTVQATHPESGTDLQFDLRIGGLDKAGMDKARKSVDGYEVSG